MQESKAGYSGIAQATHWLSALLILTMIPLGLIMTGIESDSGQQSLYQVHVGLGLVVLVLTATRLVTLVLNAGSPHRRGCRPGIRKPFTPSTCSSMWYWLGPLPPEWEC